MDEKDDPRLDNTHIFRKPDESRDVQSRRITDEEHEKTLSSDFWSSRGNMGEKINVLVGLNLILISLVSTLIQALRKKNTLTEEEISTLSNIEEFLNKMLTQPESNLAILEKIEGIHSKIDSMLEEFSSITSAEPGALKVPTPIPEELIGIFQRNAVYLDKLGIVESVEKMISTYSNLSHLSFPNYYLGACKELFRYEVQQDKDFLNSHEIPQIPSNKLRILISKLLREAPAARLLQNLRRMFPNESDSILTSTEQDQIQDIVERYYKSISEYRSNERDTQDSLRASEGILKNYNLGTGDLESRIPNVSFNIVKEIHMELQNATEDDFRRYILSETIIMIHRLNDSILQNERFIHFLRSLK